MPTERILTESTMCALRVELNQQLSLPSAGPQIEEEWRMDIQYLLDSSRWDEDRRIFVENMISVAATCLRAIENK